MEILKSRKYCTAEYLSKQLYVDGVITDQSEAETALRKLMIQNSSRQYFLFDGSKYRKRFAFKICNADKITNYITDLQDITF